MDLREDAAAYRPNKGMQGSELHRIYQMMVASDKKRRLRGCEARRLLHSRRVGQRISGAVKTGDREVLKEPERTEDCPDVSQSQRPDSHAAVEISHKWDLA